MHAHIIWTIFSKFLSNRISYAWYLKFNEFIIQVFILPSKNYQNLNDDIAAENPLASLTIYIIYTQ